jgi:hypothetical protein
VPARRAGNNRPRLLIEPPRIELFLSPAGAPGASLTRGLGDDALATAAVVPAGALAGAPAARPESYVDPGGDPGSLRDQGWGVIAPRGDAGDRLLARIRPLLEQRAADQGAEPPVYRVPPGMTAVEAAAWIDRKLVDNALPEAIPGYLLVLGRPDQVSFELQQALAGAFHVGRLGFDDDRADRPGLRDAYEAYADKLVRHERAALDPSPVPAPARVVYVTARDGTPATELAHRLLIQPCVADAEQQRAAGKLAAELTAIDGDDPARIADQLRAAVAQPGVLFTASHGAGAPPGGWPSPDRGRALQGAPCLGRGVLLDADAVAGAPFLPRGIWLLFACFGAGTPARSAYHPWLAQLQQHGDYAAPLAPVLASLPTGGEPAFLAALPQAVLARPDGPLAVIGHLDLAWSYSFCDLDKLSRGERHRRFHTLVAQLARGTRAGLALSASLIRARTQVLSELAAAAADPSAAPAGTDADAAHLAHRWMVLQDLAGYVVLGDPAARLAGPGRGASR